MEVYRADQVVVGICHVQGVAIQGQALGLAELGVVGRPVDRTGPPIADNRDQPGVAHGVGPTGDDNAIMIGIGDEKASAPRVGEHLPRK